MNIGIFGIELSSPNKGCSALGYSFLAVLFNVLESDQDINIYIAARNLEIPDDVELHGANVSVLKIENKNPMYYIKLNKMIKNCDIVFDFTEGDSFTEIYGIKRFILTTLMKQMVINSNVPLILGPQTYGPIIRKTSKMWMKKVVEDAKYVFVRDEMSLDFLNEFVKCKCILTNDIAFELPYISKNIQGKKVKIGLNPSGLLWNGGYSGDNQFNLTIDYEKYIVELVKFLLLKEKYDVHLISHVILHDKSNPESDNFVCENIHNMFPNTIMAPLFDSPVEAKSYISAMDCFIGSRMHATIASYSSGVPTIPVSYSRKFEGLYKSLKYSYVIHATKCSTEQALASTKYWVANRSELKKSIEDSKSIVEAKSSILYAGIKDVFCGLRDEKVS